jgi:hypothetical protein
MGFGFTFPLLQKRLLTCTLLKLCWTQVLFNKRRMQVKCLIWWHYQNGCENCRSRRVKNEKKTWKVISQLYKVNTEQNINNILLINMTQSCQIKQRYPVFSNLLSFSSYLRKPLLRRSTAFICNIDHDWMIYRKHPIRSLLTLMLRKANIRYPSDVYALSFEKYKDK